MTKRAKKYEKKLILREDVTFEDVINIAVKKPIQKNSPKSPPPSKKG